MCLGLSVGLSDCETVLSAKRPRAATECVYTHICFFYKNLAQLSFKYFQHLAQFTKNRDTKKHDINYKITSTETLKYNCTLAGCIKSAIHRSTEHTVLCIIHYTNLISKENKIKYNKKGT